MATFQSFNNDTILSEEEAAHIAALRKQAYVVQVGNKFWKDGFFARFRFVCPPKKRHQEQQ